MVDIAKPIRELVSSVPNDRQLTGKVAGSGGRAAGEEKMGKGAGGRREGTWEGKQQFTTSCLPMNRHS